MDASLNTALLSDVSRITGKHGPCLTLSTGPFASLQGLKPPPICDTHGSPMGCAASATTPNPRYHQNRKGYSGVKRAPDCDGFDANSRSAVDSHRAGYLTPPLPLTFRLTDLSFHVGCACVPISGLFVRVRQLQYHRLAASGAANLKA